MRNWLSRSKRSPIGLDIGAEGIRMLQLTRSGGRLAVQAAARWHYPPGVLGVEADAPTRQRLAVEAVREILKNSAFNGRDVVSCLRGDEVVVKNIRLPHMSDSELSGAVMWEYKERFGFEVSPDRVFYVNAGEVRQGTEVKDEILLMGVKEETVAGHLELLSEMGLRPVHVDSEPTALFRAYERFLRRAEDESVVTVIVDIGLAFTKVVVARGKTLLLIKSIDIAGRTFNQCVGKELGMDAAEAAHLRRRGAAPAGEGEGNSGDAVEWSLFDAMREQVQNLAREISLCLRYCSVTFRGVRPAKVVLAGGESYDPGLVKLLNEYLDTPCVAGEPLRGIEVGHADLGGERRSLLTEWSVSVGLALRGLPCEKAQRNARDERSRISA